MMEANQEDKLFFGIIYVGCLTFIGMTAILEHGIHFS